MTPDDYRRCEFGAVAAEGIYLNHAGVSPLPARVVQSIERALAWSSKDPVGYFERGVIPTIRSARVRLARLMGVPPAHLAFTKNTGHALSIVADGMILDPGDNVVVADCEYPSVVYPWKAQSRQGVETRFVRTRP